MAYAKKTLADLKQSLADKHDSGTLPTDSATLSNWTRLLNLAQEYCATYLRLQKSVSLTTVSGTIALPDDFMLITSVRNSGNVPLTQVSQNETDRHTGLVFWITGNHQDGYYLNTPSDETYTVFYGFHPSEMSSNTDVCMISNPEAVVLYAYAKLRLSETDPLGDADKSIGESARLLDEIADQMQLNDKELGFEIEQSTVNSWWENQ